MSYVDPSSSVGTAVVGVELTMSRAERERDPVKLALAVLDFTARYSSGISADLAATAADRIRALEASR